VALTAPFFVFEPGLQRFTRLALPQATQAPQVSIPPGAEHPKKRAADGHTQNNQEPLVLTLTLR